jgi:hypothetical protein
MRRGALLEWERAAALTYSRYRLLPRLRMALPCLFHNTR